MKEQNSYRNSLGGNAMKTDRGFSLLELLIVVAIILIIATIAVPALLRSRQSANEAHAVANLRTLNTGEVSYLSNHQGQYGGIPELITGGLVDFRYSQSSAGYNFDVQLTPDYLNYTATATAQSANAGKYDFYSGPDYVIRYSTDPTRAPAGLTGEPVQ
jgi:prepilin-type N-terminal cleavage/methylation domain-containing protein